MYGVEIWTIKSKERKDRRVRDVLEAHVKDSLDSQTHKRVYAVTARGKTRCSLRYQRLPPYLGHIVEHATRRAKDREAANQPDDQTS